VYQLSGDTLTIAFEDSRGDAGGIDDPFVPAARRTVETYHRIRRTGDNKPALPRPFPSGPGQVLEEWDEAARGVLQGPPRGVLNGMQLREYDDGILILVRARSGFLDDPPAADLAPDDVPSGTLGRSGGRTI